MRVVRKRCFSLLEILVSMGLAMGVLAALMGFYGYVTYIGKMGKDLEKKTFDTLFLQFRLTELLPRTVPFYEVVSDRNKAIRKGGVKKNDLKQTYEFNFFTSQMNGMPSLTFLFFGESSAVPEFSGKRLGRLFVDENRRFCFAMLPSPAGWSSGEELPVKIEVLAENVENLTFAFFVPLEVDREEMWKDLKIPKKKDDQPNPLAELPPGQWVPEWRNEYLKLPPLVRIEIEHGKGKEMFTIPLVKSEFIPVYE